MVHTTFSFVRDMTGFLVNTLGSRSYRLMQDAVGSLRALQNLVEKASNESGAESSTNNRPDSKFRVDATLSVVGASSQRANFPLLLVCAIGC